MRLLEGLNAALVLGAGVCESFFAADGAKIELDSVC